MASLHEKLVLLQQLASAPAIEETKLPNQPPKKKRKKTGGKSKNLFEANTVNNGFIRIDAPSTIKSYKNVQRQYHENIKSELAKILNVQESELPFDFRSLSSSQLESAGAIECIATAATMLENRKATGGLAPRFKGEALRCDGYTALFRRFCTIWSKAVEGRSKKLTEQTKQKGFKAIFLKTQYEVIKIPVMPPTKEDMKQIFKHLNKNDTVINLYRKLLIYLCTFFESRTGDSLQRICFESFRFVPEQGMLLYRRQNTKTSRWKKEKVRIVLDNEEFNLVFNAYFKLRERCVVDAKTPFLLQIRDGAENCIVENHLDSNFKVFKPTKISAKFIRCWFGDLAEEAGLVNPSRFKGKSIRQFLAVIEEEAGVNTWKNKSLISSYNNSRRKLCQALQAATSSSSSS